MRIGGPDCAKAGAANTAATPSATRPRRKIEPKPIAVSLHVVSLRRRYAAACRGAMAISLEIRSGEGFRRGAPTVAGSAGTRQRSGSDLPRHIGPAGGAR
jgi:hypothetical protein